MSIEAMKQALEALEDYEPNNAHKAITALRTAIAEAEKQEPVAWITAGRHTVPLRITPPAAQPAPVQEPVAHLWQHSETGRTRVVMHDQIITADATWFVVGPLYLGATPPAAQRQWVGLTDEELEKAFPAIATYHEANKTLYRSIARAIEQHLKEKNHA